MARVARAAPTCTKTLGRWLSSDGRHLDAVDSLHAALAPLLPSYQVPAKQLSMLEGPDDFYRARIKHVFSKNNSLGICIFYFC